MEGGEQKERGRGTSVSLPLPVNIRATTSTLPTITLGDQITIAHPGSAQCPIACEHIKVTTLPKFYCTCLINMLMPHASIMALAPVH